MAGYHRFVIPLLVASLSACARAERPEAPWAIEPPPASEPPQEEDRPGHHEHGPPARDRLAQPQEEDRHPDRQQPTTTQPVQSAGPLRLTAAISHASYARSSPERLILKIDLVASASPARARRPLNLAFVIDRSGSMAEDKKFMYAMQAARQVVENLTDRDLVALVAFNDDATLLSPSGPAVNKQFLEHRLGEIGPAGATNLSAGLLEGLAQVERGKQIEGQLRQVIVLTDGLANRGVTDPAALRKIVSAAHSRGVGLSTLGCGIQFDEQLLTALAEAGGGRYTYVRTGEDIPAAMSAELGGLLEVVAQNARLDVKAGDDASITRVYGRLLDRPAPAQSFTLGDMRQAEHSVFLMELAPQKRETGGRVQAEIELTFDDPQQGVRVTAVTQAESNFTSDREQVERGANDGIVLYASVRDALEKAEEALTGFDIDRFREASRRFDRVYERARRRAIETRDQEMLNQAFLLKHFMSELAVASDAAMLHSHGEARRRIQKDVEYRRYLLEHHRGGHD